MNHFNVVGSTIYIFLAILLNGTKIRSSTALPSSSIKIPSSTASPSYSLETASVTQTTLHNNENDKNISEKEAYEDYYNITKTQVDNATLLHCYGECINPESYGLAGGLNRLHPLSLLEHKEGPHEQNTSCNMSCCVAVCVSKIESIFKSCPSIPEQTKEYIDHIKFWLDGVIKVITNGIYNQSL